MVRARKNDPRRLAEQFFLSLRTRDGVVIIDDESIEVLYPERFATGKAILVVQVPVKHLPLRVARAHLDAMRDAPYAPYLDGDRGKLVFFIPCPTLRQEEADEVVREARRNAAWAKRTFGFRNAIVSPGGSRTAVLLRRLRAV